MQPRAHEMALRNGKSEFACMKCKFISAKCHFHRRMWHRHRRNGISTLELPCSGDEMASRFQKMSSPRTKCHFLEAKCHFACGSCIWATFTTPSLRLFNLHPMRSTIYSHIAAAEKFICLWPYLPPVTKSQWGTFPDAGRHRRPGPFR